MIHRVLLIVVFALLPGLAQSEELTRLQFLLLGDTPTKNRIIGGIEAFHPDLTIEISSLKKKGNRYYIDSGPTEINREKTLIITLDERSLKYALEHNVKELLSLRSSAVTYNAFVNEYKPKSISAVFSDAKLEHQFALISYLYRKKSAPKIGAVVSRETEYLRADLNALALRFNMDIVISSFEENDNSLDNSIKSLETAGFNALLSFPDPNAFPPKRLNGLIKRAYQQHKVLIGFTPAMINKSGIGAVATAVPDSKGIAIKASEMITRFRTVGAFPSPTYSDTTDILINEHVANSRYLNLEVTHTEYEIRDYVEKILNK